MSKKMYWKNVWHSDWKDYAVRYGNYGHRADVKPPRYEIRDLDTKNLRVYDEDSDTFSVFKCGDYEERRTPDPNSGWYEESLSKKEIEIYERYVKAWKLMNR